MAHPGLALGGIALIGIGIVVGFGWWWPSSAEASSQVTTLVRTVRIDNGSGAVKVRTANVTETTVRRSYSYNWGKPGDSFRTEGDQLVLSGCGRNCSVDYDVTVPAGTTVTGHDDSGNIELAGVASVDVSADSGSVKATDVTGPVKVKASSGDIDLSGIARDVNVRAGSGTITGDRLRGKVDAQADSGDITLSLDVAQDVLAHCDSGSLKITVPNDRYRVESASDSGRVKIDVTNDPSAVRTLKLGSSSGDVTVHAA